MSVVPSKASVDVDRESGCEVNRGDTQAGRKCLECPISCLTRYSHLRFSICPFDSLLQTFSEVGPTRDAAEALAGRVEVEHNPVKMDNGRPVFSFCGKFSLGKLFFKKIIKIVN